MITEVNSMITIMLSVVYFFVCEMFKSKGFQHHSLGCCWFQYILTAKLAKQINAKYSAVDEDRTALIVGCPHKELVVHTGLV